MNWGKNQMNSFEGNNHKYREPLNFDPKDKRFDIFANHQFKFFPAPKIEIVRNARISNNSAVFKSFKIFCESCIGEEVYKKYQKNFSRFYLKLIFTQSFLVKKNSFSSVTNRLVTAIIGTLSL